jgi:hypothetical protein
MKRPFKVRTVGSFYSYELLDERGCEVYSLEKAADIAEKVYEFSWQEVYNGEEGIDREDWLHLLEQN